MYYTLKNKLAFGTNLLHWKTPQQDVSMTYEEFSDLLNNTKTIDTMNNVAKNTKVISDNINSTHYYLTISANEGSRTNWIAEAFPYFSNNNEEMISKHGFDVFHRHTEAHDGPELTDSTVEHSELSEPIEYKGINCRIGSAGSTAAAHFDSHGNFVALVRGIRRYILLPPNQCDKLHLYPKSHPSARHSSIDWGNTSQVKYIIYTSIIMYIYSVYMLLYLCYLSLYHICTISYHIIPIYNLLYLSLYL